MGHSYLWAAIEAYLSRTAHPVFGSAGAALLDSGAGKVANLHKVVESVIGHFPIHNQTVGDCVSHGFGLAVDIVKCVEIYKGEPEAFVGETATEAIYATSRVEIGGGELGNEDGSVGAWAAEAVKKYGTLVRKKYDGVDLTTYSGDLARQWGKRGAGLPNDLEPVSREHPIRTASLVTSYEDARDAIFNGYPVPVCSSQGFTDVRDSQGFAKPSGKWSHCMCFIGMDDKYSRPGLLCMNSWGPDWISGPSRHDQPRGSFWTDADVADKMLRKNADSYALSGFDGFPAQDVFDIG